MTCKSWIEDQCVAMIGLFALIATIVVVAYFSDRASCQNYAELTGEQFVYQFNGGCRIKREGRWVSLRAAEDGARDITLRAGQ